MGYRAKIAIDFGSTNTVIAWKIYEVDALGNVQLSAKLNSQNNSIHIPTIMVLKSDNSESNLKEDYFGAAAVNLIREANTKYVSAENFKQRLYNETSDSESYRIGVQLTKKFFTFLLRTCKTEIIDRFPNSVIKNMKNTLFLSTPVRADPTHRALMRDIAKEVGFDEKNNFVEICTDFDEASCVIHYAIENKPKNMSGIISKATDGAIVLFVDVGGSTMDMALLRANLNSDTSDTKLSLDTVSLWPNADEKYLLGGSLIDEAIRDYLINEGFAVKSHTLNNWNTGDGKFRFRTLKEEKNSTLKDGGSITELGLNFSAAIFDPYEEMPRVKYGSDKNKLITPKIFEEVICKEYIENMEKALSTLFEDQRRFEGSQPVTAKDVDLILISGAGSKLYFIKNIFLREKYDFRKIIQQPAHLLSEWNVDSSLCCALGALVDKPDNIDMPGYSRDNYSVKVCLYIMSENIEKFLRNDPDELTPQTKEISYKIGNSETCAKIECIFETEIFTLTKKFQSLPLNPPLEPQYDSIEFSDFRDGSFDYMMLQLQLFRKSVDNRDIKIGKSFIAGISRKLGSIMINAIRSLPVVRDHTEKISKTSIKLNLKMYLSENYSFRTLAEFKGNCFEMGGQTFQMNL